MKCNVVLFAIGCFLVTSFASCKKEDSIQGPPDYGDPNYVVCRVNGRLRKSIGLGNWNRRTGVSYKRFIDIVSFGGDNDVIKDDLGIYINMKPDSVRRDTTYQFGGESNIAYGVYTLFKLNEGRTGGTYTTRNNSGWVRFSRIDTAIAAGSFGFTAYLNSQVGTDSVIVTDGVFSIAVQ